MNYELRVHPGVWCDLRQISEYIISEFNAPHIAARITNKILTRMHQLTIMPECGRLYAVTPSIQVRSVRAAKYNIVFSVDKKAHLVKILLVAHSRRNLAKLLKSRDE